MDYLCTSMYKTERCLLLDKHEGKVHRSHSGLEWPRHVPYPYETDETEPECPHLSVRVFRSEPPSAVCLSCEKPVQKMWVVVGD